MSDSQNAEGVNIKHLFDSGLLRIAEQPKDNALNVADVRQLHELETAAKKLGL